MLILKEKSPDEISHEFNLSSIINDEKISFELQSETYPGVNISFTLEYEKYKIPSNYTVQVQLFKNTFFSQKDIIELKVKELLINRNRIGYFFRLDALFEKEILQINEHVFPFAYYAIEYILSKGINLQTKEIELDDIQYKISDFFDEETIILVTCNELCNNINEFNISNYLAPLYLNGFISFNKIVNIELFNKSTLIEQNYDEIKKNLKSDNVCTLKISSINSLLNTESYIPYLYSNLIQKNNDTITRFISIYQIIEIFISKIFHLKVQSKVCNNLVNLTSFELKEFLGDIQKEKSRIRFLLNEYAKPNLNTEIKLKEKIIEFFIHIQDSSYLDIEENKKLTITDVFYDYRNKLVHNYRLIHNPNINSSKTQTEMIEINSLSEILISEIVSNFNT